jgi:hypothetical protein
MASEWEAIVERFDKKAKARKAVVSKPNKLGETCVNSIHVNGGGSYGPALVNGGCSDGTAPKKGGLLRSRSNSFQNTIECQKTNKDS